MGIGTKLKSVLSGGDENSPEYQTHTPDMRKAPGSFPSDVPPSYYAKSRSSRDAASTASVPSTGRSTRGEGLTGSAAPDGRGARNEGRRGSAATDGRGARGEGPTGSVAFEGRKTRGGSLTGTAAPDGRGARGEGLAGSNAAPEHKVSQGQGQGQGEPPDAQRDYFHGVAVEASSTASTHRGKAEPDDAQRGGLAAREESRSLRNYHQHQHSRHTSAARKLPDVPNTTTTTTTPPQHKKPSPSPSNAAQQQQQPQQPVHWADSTSTSRDSTSVREKSVTAVAAPGAGVSGRDEHHVHVDNNTNDAGVGGNSASGHYHQHAVEVTDAWYDSGSRSGGTAPSPPRRRLVDAPNAGAGAGAGAAGTGGATARAASQSTGRSNLSDGHSTHSGPTQNPFAQGVVDPFGGEDVDGDDIDDDEHNITDVQKVVYHKPTTLPVQQEPEPNSRPGTVVQGGLEPVRRQPWQQQQFGSDHGSGRSGSVSAGTAGVGAGLGQDHYGPGHAGAKVMHQCEHCGGDNDISKYFRKEAVYRIS